MNINYFKEYIAIGNSRSLAEAAQKLYVSPSSLSKHLTDIEKKMGTQLLNRSTTFFEFTPAGERFLEKAITLVNYYDDALCCRSDAMDNLPRVLVGGYLRNSSIYRLLMEVSAYVAYNNYPLIIYPYADHHNEIMQSHAINDPYAAMAEELVDVSLLMVPEEKDWQDFETFDLYTERLVAAIPLNHPLAHCTLPLSLAQLEQSVITFSGGHKVLPKLIANLYEEKGLTPRIRIISSRAFGDTYVARNDNEIFFLPERDAYRIAPPSITGLVVKKLEDSACIKVQAFWQKNCLNEGVFLFLKYLKEVNNTLTKRDEPFLKIKDCGSFFRADQ